MARVAISYTVHPVDFDPDILCERCNRDRATNYIRSDYPIASDNKYRLELCDDCIQIVTSKIHQQSESWPLMEN